MKVDSVPYISQVLLATFYLWFVVEVAEVATTVSLLGAQHKKGIVWKTSRHACLLFPWVRHLAGRFPFMWQTGGLPVLYRVTVVKLLTQHITKGDSWVPISGSPPCKWWGYQSLITSSKQDAIFTLA